MARLQTASSRADVASVLDKARAAHGAGDLARAEKQYKAILDRDPHNADALHLVGLINYQVGRHAQALRFMAAALKSHGRSSDLLSDYGLVLHALGRPGEALAHFDAALAIDPDNPDLLSKRGVACLNLGRMDDALAAFDAALAREPAHADALGNRGNAMVKLNRMEEAIASYDAAIAAHGVSAQRLTNRAHALKRLDRMDEAVADLQSALSLDPNYAEAAFELATVLLSLGNYEDGWAIYEWRWRTGAFAAYRRAFTSPQWSGAESLKDRTILLHAEQGFGDAIQFVRYAEMVAERGARLVLEVQPELARLMAGVKGVAQVIARGEKLVAFDCHCPLMSLPRALGTTLATIPARTPYIDVTASDAARWAGRLPNGKPRVGICWAGAPSHRNDVNRSIALAQLARLLDNTDLTFVVLQYKPSAEDRALLRDRDHVVDVADELQDFADTAALIKQLDLVVTVDTSVAHLTGALGVPGIVMLPFAADFRWLRGRTDTPWYPRLTLVRQPRLKNWDAVIDEVSTDFARRFRPAGR